MAGSLSALRAAVEAVQSSRDDIVAGHKKPAEVAVQDSHPKASIGDAEMKASEKPEPSCEQAFRTPEKRTKKRLASPPPAPTKSPEPAPKSKQRALKRPSAAKC